MLKVVTISRERPDLGRLWVFEEMQVRGLTELMEVLGRFWDMPTCHEVVKEAIDRILMEANRMKPSL